MVPIFYNLPTDKLALAESLVPQFREGIFVFEGDPPSHNDGHFEKGINIIACHSRYVRTS